MNFPNQNSPGNNGPGNDMQGGFATTAAAMVSIVLSPPINAFTQPYVILMAERSYPYELVDLIAIAWMILRWVSLSMGRSPPSIQMIGLSLYRAPSH